MRDATSLFNQALVALDRGNRALAADRLKRVLAASPADCEAALVYARLLREDGDLTEAEATLVTAIKAPGAATPTTTAHEVEALLELADLRLAMGKPGDAARACRHALARDPKTWEAYYLLGNAFLDVGAAPEAAKAYREAIATEPFDAEVWFNLSIALERAGDAAASSEALATARRLDPSIG